MSKAIKLTNAVQSCATVFNELYLNSTHNDIRNSAKKAIVYNKAALQNWLTSIDASQIRVTFGIYTQEFKEEMNASHPTFADNVIVGKLTAILYACDDNGDSIGGDDACFDLGTLDPNP